MASKYEEKWIKIDTFAGLETKIDPSKATDGACIGGQNTSSNETDKISTRKQGFSLFASASSISGITAGDSFKSVHVFRKRDGENIIMASIKDKLLYYDSDSSSLEIITSSNQDSIPFGYADYNINTDLRSQVYFGNGYQNYSRWNGAHSLVASVTATTVTKQGTSSFADEGFLNYPATLGDTTTRWDITNPAGTTFRYTFDGTGTNPNITSSLMPVGTYIFIAGVNFSAANNGTFQITAIDTNYFEITNAAGVAENDKTTGTGGTITYDYNYTTLPYIIMNGVKYQYKGGAYGLTLTGLGTDPTSSVVSGDSVLQAIDEYSTAPKGNLYLAANNRIFVSPRLIPQSIYFSKYGNATDFVGAALVLNSTATSPGIFNLGEGGGGVTGMIQDEGANYLFKKNIVYKSTLNDALYTLVPLKPFDGKSQTIGCATSNSPFTGGNGIFFFTPDNQILYLSRLEQLDYPQASAISDVIKDTVDNYSFKNARGIVFGDRAYFAVGSTKDSVVNDTVLVYNINTKTWDTPYKGWNVTDFFIYDDGISL